MPVMTSSLPRALVLTALLGGFAFANPVYAASADAGTPAAPTEIPASAGKHHAHKSMEDRIEDRIKTLHEKLNITSDQEEGWNAVAQAMRDNESAVKALIEARHENAKTMTAIEDLQSYQKIAQAHVDGLSKVITAFEPLYGDMSEDQKKNADTVFGSFEGHRDAPAAVKSSPKKTSK